MSALRIVPPPRKTDAWGSGAYGASRAGGRRIHNGQDYACFPGSIVLPIKPGVVSRLGFPYADDLAFKYVEVTDGDGFRVRYFYVEPMVAVGQQVHQDTPLGAVQSLQARYAGITEHVHVEVFDPDGRRFDPGEYL